MKTLEEIQKELSYETNKAYYHSYLGIYICYADGGFLFIDNDGNVEKRSSVDADATSVGISYARKFLSELLTVRLHVWKIPEMFGGGKKRFYGTVPQIRAAKQEAVRKHWARIEEFTVLGDPETSPTRAFILHEDKFYLVPREDAFDLIIEHCGLGTGEHQFRTNEGIFIVNVL